MIDKTNRSISFTLSLLWLFSNSFNFRLLSEEKIFQEKFLEIFSASFCKCLQAIREAMKSALVPEQIDLWNKDYFLVSKCLQLTFIYVVRVSGK